jgi:APA family basic amino acid/polyamine antiporter
MCLDPNASTKAQKGFAVDSEPQLERGLSFTDAMSLVVGIVIGTGVFLKAAVMAQAVRTPFLVLAAWVCAGVLSLAGALVYAELGALLPQAGGEYVYLRESYGDALAFLFGWMRMTVASTGTIASLAVGFSTFLSALIPFNTIWTQRSFVWFGQAISWQFGKQQALAVALILFISAINSVGVSVGGRIQSLVTGVKLFGIVVIVGGVFLFSHGLHFSNLVASKDAPQWWFGISSFGTAMLAALWAYDGWNQMPMVAGEVQQPERNVPRALIGGMVIMIFLYTIVNLAYFLVLPVREIATSSSTLYRDAVPVAAKAAQTFLGTLGGRLVSIIFLVSTLGSLQGSVLTCARVPYAMAKDGLFFSPFGVLSKSAHTPVFSIAMQAIWASVLALSGTFDQLTDYTIFSSWIFYALVTSSVFVLRRKMPNVVRPYRTLGYPFMPIVFIGVACWLTWNTLQTRPLESLTGIIIIAMGLPLYLYFRRIRRRDKRFR